LHARVNRRWILRYFVGSNASTRSRHERRENRLPEKPAPADTECTMTDSVDRTFSPWPIAWSGGDRRRGRGAGCLRDSLDQGPHLRGRQGRQCPGLADDDRPPPRQWMLIAALMVVSLLGGTLLGWALPHVDRDEESERQEIAIQFTDPTITATGALRYLPEEQVFVLDVSGMPELPEGSVYQAWLIDENAPVPVGVMRTGSGELAAAGDRDAFETFRHGRGRATGQPGADLRSNPGRLTPRDVRVLSPTPERLSRPYLRTQGSWDIQPSIAMWLPILDGHLPSLALFDCGYRSVSMHATMYGRELHPKIRGRLNQCMSRDFPTQFGR
jgi:hypothetical protein